MSNPGVTLEVERKLVVPDGFELAALHGSDPAEHRFTSAYWDTEGGTLALAGLTFRRRLEGRVSLWQLKLPGDGSRREVEAAGGTTPPPSLVEALAGHVGLGGPLREVARLRTLRRTVEVATKHGRVEAAQDSVRVLEGRRIASRFSELELELLDGDPKAVSTLRKRIKGDPAPAATKLARALDLAPAAPAPLLERLISERLAALLAHDPGVRLGLDPEDVHQLRVAARRTLALLRGAEAWAAPEWGAALKEHVRWLLGELGPARDTDVFLAWLHEQATALGGDGRALARIEKRLAAVGEEAHATAQAALDDPRYAELLQLLHAPRLETGEPRFTPLARSETARLRRAARHATDPDDETLHRVRLRGKRARYALELAEPELGKRGAAAIRAAKGLQDVLGEHQDAAEAERRLRALAATARGTTALALGRLVELQQGRRRRARKAFPDAWKSFDAATRRALA